MTSNKDSVSLGEPKKAYRIIIRQTKPKKEENCKSFMIYDFSGKTTIDTIKKRMTKL